MEDSLKLYGILFPKNKNKILYVIQNIYISNKKLIWRILGNVPNDQIVVLTIYSCFPIGNSEFHHLKKKLDTNTNLFCKSVEPLFWFGFNISTIIIESKKKVFL